MLNLLAEAISDVTHLGALGVALLTVERIYDHAMRRWGGNGKIGGAEYQAIQKLLDKREAAELRLFDALDAVRTSVATLSADVRNMQRTIARMETKIYGANGVNP